MLNTEGIELLGIVDNSYLIYDGMDIEDKIDSIVRAYPYIKYLQIGNEYTTIVFGEDPVKRVFFSNEWEIIKKLYTPEQIKLWRESAEFTEFESLTDPKEKIQWLATKGPRTKKDPDFTVVDISAPGPSSFSKVDINPYFERIRQILAELDPKTQEKLRGVALFLETKLNKG